MRYFFLLCLFVSLGRVLPAYSQARELPALWHNAPAGQGLPPTLRAARTVQTEPAALAAVLRAAPAESQASGGPLLPVPLPDGSTEVFRIWQTPVLDPTLAARYPDIQTYAGQSVSHPGATARFDLTPQGFHAQLLGTAAGRVLLDPVPGVPGTYRSFAAADRQPTAAWQCGTAAAAAPEAARPAALPYGGQLLTYRLALACTGEYAVAVTTAALLPLTKANVLAAMVTAVNRVTGIYEQELAIRLQLIANTDAVIYLDGATDPFTNNDGTTMLTQNRNNMGTVIGAANYDIGHVFSTGGGGVAGLGVVCRNTTGNVANLNVKAQGVTGLSNPVGDAFYVDYVAHEMGHQFGGNHTFNSVTDNCGGGNRNAATAVEPGSGSTIMAYAGICGLDDLQAHSDPFFHGVSQDEIRAYVAAGGSCGVSTATGNTPPTANAGPDFVIPKGTPFLLTGSGTDPDPGATLTYDWEQTDAGAAGTAATAATSATAALFRSFPASASPRRMLPRLSALLGTPALGEAVPLVARTLNFRLTVRDNRPNGGGVASDAMTVTVANVEPFALTSLSTATTLAPGALVPLTWTVNGTNLPPINATGVDVLFSADNGLTFPYTLLANTPNDGAQTVQLPNLTTTGGRLMLRASNNIFFALNAGVITLSGPLPVELTAFTAVTRGPDVVLSWTTAQEVRNAGFEVQAQGPGDAGFRTVGFVPGQGTSSVGRAYRYTLAGPRPGLWSLRLSQRDEGAARTEGSYSPVRSVRLAAAAPTAQVWPNPAPATQATLGVYLPAAAPADLVLRDLLGRPVLTLPGLTLGAGLTEVPLPLRGLPPGIYHWQLRTAGQAVSQGKLEVSEQ